jgi:NAD(P)H-nitrite reductase large subunit
VSEGVLKEVIVNGADSLTAIGELTKAGTGCGSCKTELNQLITTLKKSPPLLTAAS